MTTMMNATGDLTLTPALARGVTVSSGLRGLMDLDQSGQPADLVARWRGTAIASVLGQLAATSTRSSAQFLHSCCGVAKQRNSIVGVESIFLSALLGTIGDAPELDLADATWAALPPPRLSGDLLIPVLDPIAEEICFLSSHDLAGLTGLALKAQLAALCNARAASVGATADQLKFGAAVLLSATSVMSAAVIAPLPDTAPEKIPAVAALQPNGGSSGLPLALTRGAALLVETELIADIGDISSAPTAGWKSVWPQTEALPSDVDPAEALRHPYWRASQLCPSRPVTGAGLPGQVLVRQNELILQSVPQVGFDGSLLRQGFYPAQGPHPAPSSDGNWRWPTAINHGSDVPAAAATRLPHIETTPMKIIGGTATDPLTGNPVDPTTGLPIPGQGGGSSAGAILRRQLVTAVRTGRYATTAQLGDVLQRVVATDYEL